MSLKDLLESCVAKSVYMDRLMDLFDIDDIVETLEGDLAEEKSLEENKKQLEDCSGYAIMADIVDLKNDTEYSHYSLPIKPHEEIIDGPERIVAPNVGHVPSHKGLEVVTQAINIQMSFQNMLNDGFTEISDFTPTKIEPYMGNMLLFNIEKEPSNSYYCENSADSRFKDVREDLIRESTTRQLDRILVVDGDKGSAVKRKRNYIIDTLTLSDKDLYDTMVKDRKNCMNTGEDYFCKTLDDFLYVDFSVYKCITINYLSDLTLLKPIIDKAEEFKIPLFGIYLDPNINDKSMCQLQELQMNSKNYLFNKDRVLKYGLQVLNISNNIITFCCSHGICSDPLVKMIPGLETQSVANYVKHRYIYGRSDWENMLSHQTFQHYSIHYNKYVVGLTNSLYYIMPPFDQCQNACIVDRVLRIPGDGGIGMPINIKDCSCIVKRHIDNNYYVVDIDLPILYPDRLAYCADRGLPIYKFGGDMIRLWTDPYKYVGGNEIIDLVVLKQNWDTSIPWSVLNNMMAIKVKGVSFSPVLQRHVVDPLGSVFMMYDYDRAYPKLLHYSIVDEVNFTDELILGKNWQFKDCLELNLLGTICLFGGSITYTKTEVIGGQQMKDLVQTVHDFFSEDYT